MLEHQKHCLNAENYAYTVFHILEIVARRKVISDLRSTPSVVQQLIAGKTDLLGNGESSYCRKQFLYT